MVSTWLSLYVVVTAPTEPRLVSPPALIDITPVDNVVDKDIFVNADKIISSVVDANKISVVTTVLCEPPTERVSLPPIVTSKSLLVPVLVVPIAPFTLLTILKE